MAKLTDVRDTPEIANGAKVIAVPVKGGTTIYQGALVALDASGNAIPGKKAESLTAVGRAEETVTNTGADGELVIRVARGVFVFDNTATAANKTTPSRRSPRARLWLAPSSAWMTRASPSSAEATFPLLPPQLWAANRVRRYIHYDHHPAGP